MSPAFDDALAGASLPLASRGREPLRLMDPESVWWVQRGIVDVFAVPVIDGEAKGAREHLYRVRTGGILFGLNPEAIGSGWALIAVTTADTQLRSLPWRTLTAFDAETGVLERLGAWVEAVTLGARRGIQPKQFTPLRLGETEDIREARGFLPVERLAYIRIERGKASLLSNESLTIDAASGVLPLRSDAWMLAAPECTVVALAPGAALAHQGFWSGLSLYHALIVRASLMEIERVAAHEPERMRLKAGLSADQMHAGLSVFSSTLNRAGSAPFSELSDDPLLASCQLIGRRIGVVFPSPPHSGVERADPVEEIANAAGVRFRQVALRGGWWNKDGGHLLGRIQETKHPVALIRVSGGYELHDPSEQNVTVVDETQAASLVPFAQSFFRSLPARPLRLTDLLGFAFQGVERDLASVLGLGLLIGLLGMLTPVVTGYVFDTLIPASDRPQAYQVIGALLAVAVATAMFSLAGSMATLRVESRMDAGLQAALWDRALNLKIAFFKSYSVGDMAQRLNAINVIRQALSGTTVGTLLASTFALMNVALLFYYDLKLAAVATGLLLGAAVLTVALGFFKLRYDRQMSEATGTLSGLVLEYLRGVIKLRVTGAESRAFANWAREFGRMRRLAFGSGTVQNINDVFFSLYQVAVDIVLFAAMAWLLRQGAADAARTAASAVAGARDLAPIPPGLTTGQFIAFYGAFGQVMGAVTGLSTTFLSILNLVPVYERIRPVLDAQPETDGGKSHPGELRGDIDLVNVTFRYHEGGPAVLDGISFSITPGSFVAVVGPSGSGKSTLLRCLLGYETPEAGGVFYDNQNLTGLDARAVRRQIGVVLQHSQVMPGDIFANIVGSTQLSIEDAWEAARACGMEEDIKAMPMGMHTVISEGGNTLSGGQRQRILIARAIVQRPRILLFDEATSALDNRTQETVTRSLEQLRATRVVIAHRLTTVTNADRILVMDQGRLVQSGRYAELVAQPGIFQELAKRQLL